MKRVIITFIFFLPAGPWEDCSRASLRQHVGTNLLPTCPCPPFLVSEKPQVHDKTCFHGNVVGCGAQSLRGAHTQRGDIPKLLPWPIISLGLGKRNDALLHLFSSLPLIGSAHQVSGARFSPRRALPITWKPETTKKKQNKTANLGRFYEANLLARTPKLGTFYEGS